LTHTSTTHILTLSLHDALPNSFFFISLNDKKKEWKEGKWRGNIFFNIINDKKKNMNRKKRKKSDNRDKAKQIPVSVFEELYNLIQSSPCRIMEKLLEFACGLRVTGGDATHRLLRPVGRPGL